MSILVLDDVEGFALMNGRMVHSCRIPHRHSPNACCPCLVSCDLILNSPLANKLKECGVFGVSGDEYLNYATANRREWARKGKKMVEKYRKGTKKE